MGSGAGAAGRRSSALTRRGEKVGLVKVRLYRPFAVDAFVAALPPTRAADRRARPHEGAGRGRRAAVSGRRDGARASEPATVEPPMPRVIGGRYGLSSKEFTPAMAKAVFDELASRRAANHFTVGIVDDVTALVASRSTRSFATEARDVVRAVFYGLGGDGTVEREQELGQDHRRGDGPARAGLLRLRLEEVRIDHGRRTCASARARSARRT